MSKKWFDGFLGLSWFLECYCFVSASEASSVLNLRLSKVLHIVGPPEFCAYRASWILYANKEERNGHTHIVYISFA